MGEKKEKKKDEKIMGLEKKGRGVSRLFCTILTRLTFHSFLNASHKEIL